MVSLIVGAVRLYSGLPPSQTAAHLACGYVLPWAARCSASSATAGRPSNFTLPRSSQVAHFFVERNWPFAGRRPLAASGVSSGAPGEWCTRPATFSHPTFSLIGDFALLGSLLTGRLPLNATSPAG